jgi:eukaryotic-like serine/threonine-protein kinase
LRFAGELHGYTRDVPVSTHGTLLVGRYRVVRHLGSGGMASVLLCQDERLDRQVAVKRLHADSPGDVERRFVREAKLGASLNHPNLVSVFDTATDDDGVLIVMEYVPGEPLSKALRHGPLGPRRVARMATELGAALDHAHGQGVVHRDVKPGNVLLRNDGVTKLVDLGIATAADGTRITRSGTVLGTAAYMAPEQLDGQEPGPAVDVYALAAVCFEALAGRRPRQGKTPMQIVHQLATSPPPDLREHWPAASATVAALLKRGMARDPGERPRSAGELGTGLARALEEQPRTAHTRRLTRRTAAPAPAPVMPPRAEPAKAAPATLRGDGPEGDPPTPVRPLQTEPKARRPLSLLVAGLLLALAIATVVIVLASGDGGGEGRDQASQRSGQERQQQQQQRGERRSEQRARTEAQAPAQPAPEAEAEPEPAPEPEPTPAPEPVPESEQPSSGGDSASGADLNNQGFELMNAGRYDEAIPVLQRAVDSFPAGTSDITYAYALFNLGRSLRLAGRPAEAIPVLEQRLAIPNQRGTVQRELDLAREEAGQG